MTFVGYARRSARRAALSAESTRLITANAAPTRASAVRRNVVTWRALQLNAGAAA
jgi:hypothetical protein